MSSCLQFRQIRYLNFPLLPFRHNRGLSNGNNDGIQQGFVNRNPRNMELLRLARKPLGYCLDVPKTNYYYRLMFDVSLKYITGWVEHNTGKIVMSASSREWAIRKHLYSARDSSAAANVGKILAQRCLQAGLYEVHTDLESDAKSSEKAKLFLNSIQDGGISLGEAPNIRERESYKTWPKKPTYPWEISEEEVRKIDDHFKDNAK